MPRNWGKSVDRLGPFDIYGTLTHNCLFGPKHKHSQNLAGLKRSYLVKAALRSSTEPVSVLLTER
jgi:hypothetical protein